LERALGIDERIRRAEEIYQEEDKKATEKHMQLLMLEIETKRKIVIKQ
jgi:hypothetical protein